MSLVVGLFGNTKIKWIVASFIAKSHEILTLT